MYVQIFIKFAFEEHHGVPQMCGHPHYSIILHLQRDLLIRYLDLVVALHYILIEVPASEMPGMCNQALSGTLS